jgi:hypothetical protein
MFSGRAAEDLSIWFSGYVHHCIEDFLTGIRIFVDGLNIHPLSPSRLEFQISDFQIFRKITETKNSKTGIVVPEVRIVMEQSAQRRAILNRAARYEYRPIPPFKIFSV